MSTLTLKFDDDSYDGFRKYTFGTNKGKWVLRIDGDEFIGTTKEEVAEKLMRFVRKALKSPSVAVVKVAENATVIIHDHHGTRDHRFEIGADGVQKLRGCGWQCQPIEEAVKAELLHLSHQAWDGASTDTPEYLDPKGTDEYSHWVKWQLDYKKHIANGASDCDAHRMACGY